MIEVKILTPEFIENVNKCLDDATSDYEGIEKEIEIMEWKSFLNLLWNGSLNREDGSSIVSYLESFNILVPQFIVQEFQNEARGYQSKPRILWNGEIQKIDDIDEIYSYTYKRK